MAARGVGGGYRGDKAAHRLVLEGSSLPRKYAGLEVANMVHKGERYELVFLHQLSVLKVGNHWLEGVSELKISSRQSLLSTVCGARYR